MLSNSGKFIFSPSHHCCLYGKQGTYWVKGFILCYDILPGARQGIKTFEETFDTISDSTSVFVHCSFDYALSVFGGRNAIDLWLKSDFQPIYISICECEDNLFS